MILKTYLILLIANFLFSQKIDLNKELAFDSHHATFEIISDSLYYIVSNMADKNHLKKRGIIAILNKNGELNNLIELGQNNNYILSSTRLQNNDFLFIKE